MSKKLTFESKDHIPQGGGVVFSASLSDFIPKGRKSREKDKELTLLVIEDRDKKKDGK